MFFSLVSIETKNSSHLKFTLQNSQLTASREELNLLTSENWARFFFVYELIFPEQYDLFSIPPPSPPHIILSFEIMAIILTGACSWWCCFRVTVNKISANALMEHFLWRKCSVKVLISKGQFLQGNFQFLKPASK